MLPPPSEMPIRIATDNEYVVAHADGKLARQDGLHPGKTVKSLGTHAKNPMKYRRESFCPDSTTKLSIAFTVDALKDPATLQLMIEFAADVIYVAERQHFWANTKSSLFVDKAARS
ncbi:hypothetical protein Ae201684P_017591 [Aphanomyces euteiches]|nr:hypothetical protein Ae201684P_017591 [Aphanomyces euteiches]